MRQVDAIFSSTLKRGGKSIQKWGELGLSGEWADKPLSLYGRNSASGTYGYFKEHALKGGDYKQAVKEQPGSSAVVQGVGSDLAGIGYSGIGYKTSEVRAVPLGEEDGKFIEANYENCLTGDYPLARFLYIYVNKKPGQPPDKLTAEFIRFVESREGQEVTVKSGFFPVPKEIVEESRKQVEK
jgi:phosphate transport system substrate-binding protein